MKRFYDMHLAHRQIASPLSFAVRLLAAAPNWGAIRCQLPSFTDKKTTGRCNMCAKELRQIQNRLLQESVASDIDRPVYFWAQPSDRSLPHTVLCRTVKEVARTPLDDLLDLSGMGKKSVLSLVRLLRRAAEGEVASPPGRLMSFISDYALENTLSQLGPPWRRWCQSIRSHGLEGEPLGRFAPCLRNVPSNMWLDPLAEYLVDNPQQLRARPRFGLQRVRVVLETFNCIDELFSGCGAVRHLDACLTPKFARQSEAWIRRALQQADCPTADELAGLFDPIIEQIQHDAGETAAKVLRAWVATHRPTYGAATELARRTNVSRVRIYQVLEICGQVMCVRWPDGAWYLSTLSSHLQQRHADDVVLQTIDRAIEVFYRDADEQTEGN